MFNIVNEKQEIKALNTNEVKDFYQEKGFLHVRDVFNANEMKKARDIVNEILNTKNIENIAELEPRDPRYARRIWAPTKRHDYFRSLSEKSELLDIIELLIGHNILFHHSKMNIKAPKIGSQVEWHQDFAYYPHTNTDLVAALIFLDEADLENGCLQVLPGMHKLGLLNHYKDNFFCGKIVDPALKEASIHNVLAQAGDVIFIHCLLPHFSATNKSNKYRRVFLPTYRAADAFPIYFGEHAAHNESGIKLLRGNKSNSARMLNMNLLLPYPEHPFQSLYQLQEGSNMEKLSDKVSGYYSKV